MCNSDGVPGPLPESVSSGVICGRLAQGSRGWRSFCARCYHIKLDYRTYGISMMKSMRKQQGDARWDAQEKPSYHRRLRIETGQGGRKNGDMRKPYRGCKSSRRPRSIRTSASGHALSTAVTSVKDVRPATRRYARRGQPFFQTAPSFCFLGSPSSDQHAAASGHRFHNGCELPLQAG